MPLSSISRTRPAAALLTILFGFLAFAAMSNPRISSASSQRWQSLTNADDPHVLSPQVLGLFVNSVGDGPDANIGDGICDAGGGACTLRAAIQEANSVAGDDTISLAPFPPPSNIILSSALPAISDNVAISGPGGPSGFKINLFRNLAAGTPDFTIFTINSGKTVTISGVTIINGRASGATPNGAGIWNSGTLTLNSCRVAGNVASSLGGGIYNAGIAGGGVPATLTINDSDISNNGAEGGGGIANAAVNASSTVTINNSTIANNRSATLGGGGIHNSASSSTSLATLTINNSTLWGNANTATGSGAGGGGIYNAAASGNATSTMAINNSTISENRDEAAGSGGGIFHVSSGSGSIANLTIHNGTISDNEVTASGNGGGIYSASSSSVTNLLLRDTIVAGNGRAEITNDISGAVDPASSYNLIGTGGAGGLVNGVNSNQVGVANPLLGPLGNNGGATFTHALLDG
ncbi:MAG TPA: CSLREA domain-containing protein, partial [Pyrinomonadaceae bacterium]